MVAEEETKRQILDRNRLTLQKTGGKDFRRQRGLRNRKIRENSFNLAGNRGAHKD